MSTMVSQVVTAPLLLCFLTVLASAQQQLKGRQLDSVAHVAAISMNPERKMSNSLASVEGSESVSKVALEESLSGYGVRAFYLDNSTCTTFAAAMIYPLNSCFGYGMSDGLTNAKVTATSSSYTLQYFKDEQCNVTAGVGETTLYSSTCGADGSKYFVQPSHEVATPQSLTYLG